MVSRHYKIGDVVLGNWTLVRLIGEGSFGKVFEAHREEFGTTYKAAIKVVTIPTSQAEVVSARAEGMDDESIHTYFQEIVSELVQEFALMSKMKGTAHVVSYEDHAVIPHEDGVGWDILIRMELLMPMLDYMSKYQLNQRTVIKMGIDICKALELCQKHNIIHRDIKPENMFISSVGDFKLGDFGVARTLEKTAMGLSKKGTYVYMAPEIYREDAYGPNVDIYSLGIVMYRLLNNNRFPFLPQPPQPISHSDRELALVRRISGESLPMPANANGKLADIVMKACSFNPKDRYQTAQSMRRELEALLYEANASYVSGQRKPRMPETSVDDSGTRRTLRKPATVQRQESDDFRTTRTTSATTGAKTSRTVRESTQGKYQKVSEKKAPEKRAERSASPMQKKKRSKSKAIHVAVTVAALILLVCIGMLIYPTIGDKEAATLNSDTTPSTTEAMLETTVEKVETLSVIVTADTISKLDEYVDLKSIDLSGSTCYAEILEYQESHPQIQVTYDVSLGKVSIDNATTEITLSPADFDYEKLLENLKYLPQVSAIAFPNISLSGDQVIQLREKYPDIKLDYSVELFGDKIDLNLAHLDLSELQESQVSEAAAKIGLLTNLTTVQLSDTLSMEAVATLQDANPNAKFKYSFTLFGKQLTTSDTSVEFKNEALGNSAESEIRKALAILDECERFVLDDCSIDYNILADIRDDFPDGPNLVWRVYFGEDNRYTTLTDDEMMSAVYNVTDDTSYNLRYCNKVKYLDIGHNEYLTDLSFLGYMPDLEIVIASGSAVSKLVGLENCKNLTWLELAYCYKLSDISCLSKCENLQYLNVAYTKVSDISALATLPLVRFMALEANVSTSDQNIFNSEHPDCISIYSGQTNPYGYGWRYDDNGKTFNEYYKRIREIFNWDQAA